MTPTLGWNTFQRLIWIIGAVKMVILPRLSVWHRGDWFSESGPRRREPFTRWQPNKRLAEALCPLTSSLKADCVATQLYRADSQTAGLSLIHQLRDGARLDRHIYASHSVGNRLSFGCTGYYLCAFFIYLYRICIVAHTCYFCFLLCEERMREIQFTLNSKLC